MLPKPVLSADGVRFFDEHGYVVVDQAVPTANVLRAQAAIWAHLGSTPDDPESWYQGPPRLNGVVHEYQHQSFWDNRQNPRVYSAFAQLLGEHRLWVSIDRAKMQPPMSRNDCPWNPQPFIHFDIDVRQPPAKLVLQGVLCLSDATRVNGD
jgi:hypothetical protein